MGSALKSGYNSHFVVTDTDGCIFNCEKKNKAKLCNGTYSYSFSLFILIKLLFVFLWLYIQLSNGELKTIHNNIILNFTNKILQSLFFI
jgi:hypothetical protein